MFLCAPAGQGEEAEWSLKVEVAAVVVVAAAVAAVYGELGGRQVPPAPRRRRPGRPPFSYIVRPEAARYVAAPSTPSGRCLPDP